MTEQPGGKRVHEKWATFRFSVIGLLLAAPPPRGELDGAIAALAERTGHRSLLGDSRKIPYACKEEAQIAADETNQIPDGYSRNYSYQCDACGQWLIGRPHNPAMTHTPVSAAEALRFRMSPRGAH